jgi:hypothetical protein
MQRCYACSQENCDYKASCDCSCHNVKTKEKDMPKKKPTTLVREKAKKQVQAPQPKQYTVKPVTQDAPKVVLRPEEVENALKDVIAKLYQGDEANPYAKPDSLENIVVDLQTTVEGWIETIEEAQS